MSAPRNSTMRGISTYTRSRNTRSTTVRLGAIALVTIMVAAGLWPVFAGHGSDAARARPAAVSTVSSRGSPSSGYQANPFYFHAQEPAPMGIVDWGVFPGVSAYTYSTSQFVGTVRIDGFTTSNASLPTYPQKPADYASLQLNAFLIFSGSGGNTFYFWAQTVAILSTESNKIAQYSVDLFNTSGPDANVTRNVVCHGGNCSDCALGYSGRIAVLCQVPEDLSYVGQEIVLGLVTLSNNSGVPFVLFVVDGSPVVGLGFPWGSPQSGPPVLGVNGGETTPDGHDINVELIVGGPSGGAQTTCVGGSMTMQLQYLAANDTLQNVPHAYNFGANTEEGISGVVDSSSGNGTATLTRGSGSLGPLGPTPPPPPPSFDWASAAVLLVVIVVAVGAGGYVVVRRRRKRAAAAQPLPYPGPSPGTAYPAPPPGVGYPPPPPGTAYPAPPVGVGYPPPPPGTTYPAPPPPGYPPTQPPPPAGPPPAAYGYGPPPAGAVPPPPPNPQGIVAPVQAPVPSPPPISATPQYRLCRRCGRPLEVDARFCSSCGTVAGP